jgi:hypothetical protein
MSSAAQVPTHRHAFLVSLSFEACALVVSPISGEIMVTAAAPGRRLPRPLLSARCACGMRLLGRVAEGDRGWDQDGLHCIWADPNQLTIAIKRVER